MGVTDPATASSWTAAMVVRLDVTRLFLSFRTTDALSK
jgi:HAMP domain-containing protein